MREQISAWQLGILMFLTVVGTAVLFLPGIIARAARQDAWLVPFVVSLFTVPNMLLLGALGNRFRHLSLPEMAAAVFGRWAGAALGIYFALWATFTNAVIIREFSIFIAAVVLPYTPELATAAGIAWLGGLAARRGPEVLGRCAEMVIPLYLGFLAIVMILVLKEARWERLLPVLERGWQPLFTAAVPPAGWHMEIGLALLFLPHLRRDASLPATLLGAAAASLGLGVIGGLLGTLVLGAEAARATFPLLDLARMVSIAEFIERIDPLIVAIWVTGMFIKVGCFFYAGAAALAGGVGLTSPAPAVFPLALLSVAWAIGEWTGMTDISEWVKFAAFPHLATGLVVPPLLIWLGALVTGAGARRPAPGRTAGAREQSPP